VQTHREAEMPDTERPETRKETLRRVLAPLTSRNGKGFVLAVFFTCLIAEFPTYMLSIIILFHLPPVLYLHFMFEFLEDLYIVFYLSFLITVPHIIANVIAVSLKKKDILIELLIALSATAIFAMILENSNSLNGFIFPEFFFTKTYLLTIPSVVLADAIFYAIKFAKERGKMRRRGD
jgi:hypothetical protein